MTATYPPNASGRAADRPLSITYYAAAADATGVDTETVETAAATLGELATELARRHGDPLRALLEVSAFVVHGRLVRDPGATIDDASEVDVLPPFAGG